MLRCHFLGPSGPLYRQGGFYFEEENGDVKLCFLLQVRSLGSHRITKDVNFFARIYKDGQGYSYAVAELLRGGRRFLKRSKNQGVQKDRNVNLVRGIGHCMFLKD